MFKKANNQSTNPTKVELRSNKLQFIVIFIPLIIITALSFGYMHMKSAAIQRVLSNQAKTRQQSPSNGLRNLQLTTQPATPKLTTEAISPDQIQNTNTDDTGPGVGPASKNSYRTIQGASSINSMSSDKNDQLQATRKNIKLDDLEL